MLPLTTVSVPYFCYRSTASSPWCIVNRGKSMKTSSFIVRMFLAIATVFAVALAPVAMAGDQDFTVVNKTGIEIHQLFVTPHDSDDWEDDILGEDTLANGEQVNIKFSRKEKADMWDLKVVDSDGNEVTWENLDLLSISTVTLHYKKGKSWADVE